MNKLLIILVIFLSFSCSDLNVKDIKCDTQADCPDDAVCVHDSCREKSSPNEICVDDVCFDKIKEVDCITENPENSTAIIEKIRLEYNIVTNTWPETPLCEWTCDNFYEKTEDLSACQDINECLINNGECGDTKEFSCFNNIGVVHTCSERRLSIFSTNTTRKGDFGGHAQADVVCNNDENRPDTTRKYKAILVDLVRTPDFDWPLEASTDYYRGDYTTLIGSTDENKKMIFDLENTVNPNGNNEIWTGVYINKDVSTQEYSTVDNCDNWRYAGNDVGTLGEVGLDGVMSYQMLYLYEQYCDRDLRFFCVEQR